MSNPHMTNRVSLKPCPFCSGIARFCSEPEHDCHLILCSGCGLSFDTTDAPDVETVGELQLFMAEKWNRRV